MELILGHTFSVTLFRKDSLTNTVLLKISVAKLLCVKDWTTRSRQRDLWKSLFKFCSPKISRRLLLHLAKPIIAVSKYLAVQVHARFERPTEGFHFQTFIRLWSWSSCSVSARRHQHQTTQGRPQVSLVFSSRGITRD